MRIFSNKGDFDKAAISYEQLLESLTSNSFIFNDCLSTAIVITLDKAEKFSLQV
jgi:hypothetical protein